VKTARIPSHTPFAGADINDAIHLPDELVFNAAFAGCGSFRAGAAYHRGRGKVFYFQPGHETYQVYRQKEIQDIIFNAVYWANNKTRGQ
jgi:trehalose utilization protein